MYMQQSKATTASGNTPTAPIIASVVPTTSQSPSVLTGALNGVLHTWGGISSFFAGIPQIPGMAAAESEKLQAAVIEDLYKDGVCIALTGLIWYNTLWLISDCVRDLVLLSEMSPTDNEKRNETSQYSSSNSILKFFLDPLKKPCLVGYEYIRGIPRTGNEARGYFPCIFLVAAISVERSFGRRLYCRVTTPRSQYILQNIFLPTAAALCGVWCTLKAAHESNEVEPVDCVKLQEESLANSPYSVKSTSWTRKLRVASYSLIGSLMFLMTSGTYVSELYSERKGKEDTWLTGMLSWADYLLGYGHLVDASLLVFGVPSFGVGTIASSIRKYISVAPDGAQLSWVPNFLIAGKIVSGASGILMWFFIKRYVPKK